MSVQKVNSRIYDYISKDQIKDLYEVSMRPDINDNNLKVDIMAEILGKDFQEIGPGTNRAVFMKDGYIYKVAMDRRGLVDNVCEFIRSPEVVQYTAKVYETSVLINTMEYVTVMTKEEFNQNKSQLKKILDEISKEYIFEDIPIINKNFANWGYRSDGSIVILDYGYLYPRALYKDAMICPICGNPVEYNSTYSGLECTDKRCNNKFRFADIRRRMDKSIEKEEMQKVFDSVGIKLPNLEIYSELI